MTHKRNYIQGYTLIELAVSLAILSLLLSSGLMIFDQFQLKNKFKETNKKLEIIEEAIKTFVKINGYIPCPASINSLESESSFGDSAGVYDTVSHTCSNSLTNEVGILPSKQLGIRGNYVFDAWGNRFVYRVATGLGDNADFSISGNGSFNGDIKVVDNQGNELTKIDNNIPNNYGAAYVIISYGQNSNGAWNNNLNFVSQTSLPESGSLEAQNLNHINKVYIDGRFAKDFDDIVKYKRKDQLWNISYAKSPINIPNQACYNSSLILDNGVNSLGSTSLGNYILEAAQVTQLLCNNQLNPNSCTLNPKNVQGSNISLWIEGKYPNSGTLNNGDNVCTIQDRSGNNFNLTSTSLGCPTYATSTPFGRNRAALFFSNNDIIGNFGILNNSAYTIFLVATKNPNSSPTLGIGADPLSSSPFNNQQLMLYNDKATQTGNDLGVRGGYRIKDGEPILLVYMFDQTQHLFKLRTRSNLAYEIQYPDNSNLSNTSFLHLSPNIAGISSKFHGYIGELIIYNTGLNNQNIKLIEDYLFKKWFSGECDFSFN